MLVFLLSKTPLFKGDKRDEKLIGLALFVYAVAFFALWRKESTKKYAKYLIPAFIADIVVYKLVLSKQESKRSIKKKSVNPAPKKKTLNSKVAPKVSKPVAKPAAKPEQEIEVDIQSVEIPIYRSQAA